MFKILGFKKEKKKKKKPPLQICEFQWKMSICGNWKVLWCFQCISWIGERKKRLKASFWNGWKAPFQHFGRETFLVFILKWLSIYFFHYIMCYKYDTKSSQIEAWHLCLLKVNCFELPERTLRCFFFFIIIISSAENSDISRICSAGAPGPISTSTGKWHFYPPRSLWGHKGSATWPRMSHCAAYCEELFC